MAIKPGDICNADGDILLVNNKLAKRGAVVVSTAQAAEALKFGWRLQDDVMDDPNLVMVKR